MGLGNNGNLGELDPRTGVHIRFCPFSRFVLVV